MERAAFELLSTMEQSWWYRGRAQVVLAALQRFVVTKTEKLLDYGAGSGGMYATFAGFAKSVIGFEPDSIAAQAARERGYARIYATSEEALRESYQVVAMCDVLEHIDNDLDALKKINAALTPHGHLVITVPAYQWLWSVHDVAHHHFRRYTRSQLAARLVEAGFRVEFISHWNMTLFPLAALMRLIGKSGEGATSLPRFLNDIFLALIGIEAALMHLVPLPFGLSIIAVAAKK